VAAAAAAAVAAVALVLAEQPETSLRQQSLPLQPPLHEL